MTSLLNSFLDYIRVNPSVSNEFMDENMGTLSVLKFEECVTDTEICSVQNDIFKKDEEEFLDQLNENIFALSGSFEEA